ncbi:hypothetical protein P9112_012106 [Eukaryota sp. TZLM1-RC]
MVKQPSIQLLPLLFFCLQLPIIFYCRSIPPYMDEPFHFNQSLIFSSFDYKWDPKLTTFPGLFLITSPFLFIAKTLTISPEWLLLTARLVNLALYCLCLPVACSLTNKDNFSLLTALSLFLLPFSWFFSLLFYTDPGSLLFLLLFFKSCSSFSKPSFKSFIFGFLAVLFRQTNIIFIISIVVFQYYPYVSAIMRSPLNFKSKINSIFSFCYSFFPSILLILILFSTFFILNDFSIVLGDKSAHKPVLHLSMINYFGFLLIYLLPELIILTNKAINLSKKTFLNLLFCFVIWSVIYFLFVYFFGKRISHLYLISDNRHYLFYLYRIINTSNPFLLLIAPSLLFSILVILLFSNF